MSTRDIIVVAASVGGVDAIGILLESLPAGLPAAVLIVLHTSPQSPMLLAEIFRRRILLSVAYASQGTRMTYGQVYIAPPNRHLVVAGSDLLALENGPKVHHTRPAADRLFVSAAREYGSRVIGVVLTGVDGDGTEGLRAIKRAGGIGIVQEPAEAVAPGMPTNALKGDSPAYTLPLAQIGPLLVRLATPGRTSK